jgi:hypothetical protein
MTTPDMPPCAPIISPFLRRPYDWFEDGRRLWRDTCTFFAINVMVLRFFLLTTITARDRVMVMGGVVRGKGGRR